jgi:prepilin-type N-terminal cleavage/methylation domain-containing protein
MKKQGFTLAEVLITLSIIGVVATMTLPSLMANTQEQQAKTALKKAINTLTEAASMNLAMDGFDYANIINDDTNDGAQSLVGILRTKTQIDYAESQDNFKQGGKIGHSDNFAVFFKDGTALSFPTNVGQNSSTWANQLEDGLVEGFGVVFDTNGTKAPNVISNCAGKVTLDMAISDQGDITACNNKKQRVIKDQFALKLRGSTVVPNGRAARWAMQK